MYPEDAGDVPHKFRGRLQLLYDEWGTLKCETCFQCAQACPIECIDMGGIDTKGRYHVHWGAPETYGERREESALRRSGRTVPDPAYAHFDADRPRRASTRSSTSYDHDPTQMLADPRGDPGGATATCPVAALKRISQPTGAWYAMIYGTATYYRHLRFEPADGGRRRTAAATAAGARAGRARPALRSAGRRVRRRARRGADRADLRPGRRRDAQRR